MGFKINKRAYQDLVEQDLEWLNKNCKDKNSLELDHIKLILCSSIDMYYPSDGNKEIESTEQQLLQTDVIKSVCEHKETETLFMGGSEYMVKCKDCREILSE